MKENPLFSSHLLLGKALSEKQWREIFSSVFKGHLEPVRLKPALLFLAKKGEDAPAIRGCLRALLQLEPPQNSSLPFLMDVCGTGGDGKKTFNVSTVSAFVIAGAGAYMAKHGNRAVSSRSGSSDLMEALGVRLDIPFSQMLDALHRFHFGYFHAPFCHPSFKKVERLRAKLGVRTIFNLLGPLVNPLRLSYQMIGVSNPDWSFPIAKTLTLLGRKKAVVFRSAEGMDELSTHEPSGIFYVEGGKIRKEALNPGSLGFKKTGRDGYTGGDARANREIALGILKNQMKGPRQDIVLLNSGFALHLVGLASTLKEGIERSHWAIRTGKAFQVLEALRQVTNRRNGS